MEIFEQFFQHSIEMCREAGLLSEGPVYVDTTLVQAAASMDSLVGKEEAVKPPLSIHEYMQRLYAENVSSSQRSLSDAKVLPRYRKCRPDGHRRKANNELISRTDPEATVVSRRGFDMHLAYKAHIAVAGRKGQVITTAVATIGARAQDRAINHFFDQQQVSLLFVHQH